MARSTDTIPLLDTRQIGSVINRLSGYTQNIEPTSSKAPLSGLLNDSLAADFCQKVASTSAHVVMHMVSVLDQWVQNSTCNYRSPKILDRRTGDLVVTYFIQKSKAQQAGYLSHPIAVKTDELPAVCQKGVEAGKKEYPIATFFDPVEYTWSEDRYEARQAAKRYSEESHANY